MTSWTLLSLTYSALFTSAQKSSMLDSSAQALLSLLQALRGQLQHIHPGKAFSVNCLAYFNSRRSSAASTPPSAALQSTSTSCCALDGTSDERRLVLPNSSSDTSELSLSPLLLIASQCNAARCVQSLVHQWSMHSSGPSNSCTTQDMSLQCNCSPLPDQPWRPWRCKHDINTALAGVEL